MADTATAEPFVLPAPPRFITDLNKFGGPAVISDGASPDGIQVWVQKLTTPEMETVRLKAGGARAAALTVLHDAGSEEYLEALGALIDLLGEGVMGIGDATSGTPQSQDDLEAQAKRDLAGFLVQEDFLKAMQAAYARRTLDSDDPNNVWAKDGYITELQVAWQGSDEAPGLKSAFAEYGAEPGDDAPAEAHEAARVMREIKKFTTELSEELDAEKEALIDSLMDVPLAELRERSIKLFVSNQAAMQYKMTEDRWRIYFSTRQPDNHNVKYFAGVRPPKDWDGSGQYVTECDDYSVEVLNREYQRIEVSDAEGKASRSDTSSSSSSEAPNEAEGSPPSTPTDTTPSPSPGS